ncbi:MAG: ribosome-recycling factor [Candidatus Absconditicoccaceae bacterium]
MNKAIAFLEGEFKALQVGRASTGLVENINVEASYGMFKIPQLAHVTIMDGQTIKIEPRDKGEIKHIEKAIYDANIGLTPQNDGGYLIVRIPALTQDRRQEIVKQVKSMGEECKTTIRKIRQEAMKDTKQIFDNKEIGEDQHKTNEKEIEDLVKKAGVKIEELTKIKSEEIMKI